jgi:hypothetical protein
MIAKDRGYIAKGTRPNKDVGSPVLKQDEAVVYLPIHKNPWNQKNKRSYKDHHRLRDAFLASLG